MCSILSKFSSVKLGDARILKPIFLLLVEYNLSFHFSQWALGQMATLLVSTKWRVREFKIHRVYV